jgi:hypothetical protein
MVQENILEVPFLHLDPGQISTRAHLNIFGEVHKWRVVGVPIPQGLNQCGRSKPQEVLTTP